MDQLTWLALGVLALLPTIGILLYDLDEIVFGFGGIIPWAIWGFGATNVEIITNTGTVVQRSYPQLAFVALALIVLHLVLALEGKLRFLTPSSANQPQEMRR